ncbi:MAG: peptide chain release factor 3 [Lentisphaeria bacterium]|nr:peptide chain release factor 3 [Lentisphaeria bacterium]
MSQDLANEVSRRRTLAIISHPDAGKTTLTEKLLLYGGAVQLAGSVRARRSQRSTTSDWMELERERGISISSTVLQFDYRDHVINLLDTPGHRDFSEDTYRVLTAVDSVIMVIDAGKGIEDRTRRLFEICRLRGIPIFTFMNKMDRPALEPLVLVDELERVLGIGACPVTWPLGDGVDFRGVYDRLEKRVHLFEASRKGSRKAVVQLTGAEDPCLAEMIHPQHYREWMEHLELLDSVGESFDTERIREGALTPVFFGSAMNNFGVQLLLDTLIDHGMPPCGRNANGRALAPTDPAFSAFVFKIQANMDPNHRDSLAFIRVCSGVFRKDMVVPNPRHGRPLRLSYPQRLFGQERQTVQEAYPGDIVGLVSHGGFRIGDTLSEIPGLVYREIPRFAPEVFAFLHNPSPSRYKQFRAGLEQLLDEGVVQVFHLDDQAQRAPLLGAVGQLQFDVAQYRLEVEYGAQSRLEPAPYREIRWLDGERDAAQFQGKYLGSHIHLARDAAAAPVLLFPDAWSVDYFQEKHAGVVLRTVSPLDGRQDIP